MGWLCLMLAASPVADRLATSLVARPPTLKAFRLIRQSTGKLVAGIVVAWVLGGFGEEIALRGLLLPWVERQATPWGGAVAPGMAVAAAAMVAAAAHLYQGLRGALVIGQLSILFGLLFILDGHNLWSVILCHGLYDTIAFVRFASGKSRYAQS